MNLSAASKSKITKSNEKRVDEEVLAPVVVLTSKKKVSENIAKWGERQSEIKSQSTEEKEKSPPKTKGMISFP